MDWIDEGLVLSSRAHGEINAVVEILTREHGRHMGLVRGGRGRRQRPVLQPGNVVRAQWRARLSDHLGTYTLELMEARAARALDDAGALAGLSTLCALSRILPERDPHPSLHEAARLILEHLEDVEVWPRLLVRWELELLSELGFRLDLAACALTGTRDDLAYISPKTGRAVSQLAGAPYRDRLLALPRFLANGSTATTAGDSVAAGFALTGHFLAKHVFVPRGLKMPEARERMIAILCSDEPVPALAGEAGLPLETDNTLG